MAIQAPGYVRQTVTGTATDDVTLGSADLGFRTLQSLSYADGTRIPYYLLVGSDWECGIGLIGGSNTTLQRASGRVIESSSGFLTGLEDIDGKLVVDATPFTAQWRGLAVEKGAFLLGGTTTQDVSWASTAERIDTEGIFTSNPQTTFTLPSWVAQMEVAFGANFYRGTASGMRVIYLLFPSALDYRYKEYAPGAYGNGSYDTVQIGPMLVKPGSAGCDLKMQVRNSGLADWVYRAWFAARFLP